MAVPQTIVIRNSYINYPGVSINGERRQRDEKFKFFVVSFRQRRTRSQ